MAAAQQVPPQREIDKLLVQTMDQLGLRPHARKHISQLSGGQRKRVSVGVELLAKPAVLFLDEPSSGLDPATEFQLMELLRDLADTGCTIVCTTHVMENAYPDGPGLIVLVGGGCLASPGLLAQSAHTRNTSSFPSSPGSTTGSADRLAERVADRLRRGTSDPDSPEDAPPAPASLARPSKPARRAFALPILLARQWTILRSDWRNFVLLAGQPIIIAAAARFVGRKQRPGADHVLPSTRPLLWKLGAKSNAAQVEIP